MAASPFGVPQAGVLPSAREPRRARLDAWVRTWAMLPDHPAAEFIRERSVRAISIWSAMGARRQPMLAAIEPRDCLESDNSAFLAAQTYHRHQIPPDAPVWNQFRKR